MSVVVWVLVLLCGLSATFAAWHVLLGRCSLPTIRWYLVGIAMVVLLVELRAGMDPNLTKPTIFLWPTLAINIWANLDSALRYPHLHEIDSFFSLKFGTLMCLKIVVFVIGYKAPHKNPVTFLFAMVASVWGYPLMYIMALPLDTAYSTDVENEDLVIRIYRLCTDIARLRYYRDWLVRVTVQRLLPSKTQDKLREQSVYMRRTVVRAPSI
jgi:hypothetical protein